MNKSEDINPNDPLFLVSRDLDGDLSAAEKSRLERLLGESAELRGEALAFRRMESLLTARRDDEARIDWLNYEKLILARVEDSDDESPAMEQVLHAWGRRQPEWDQEGFAGEVLSRIATPQKRAMPWWKVVRLGAPLAAAAAIVIAFTATWQTPLPVVSPAPLAVVEIHRSDARSSASAVSIVSFARSMPRPAPLEESVSFGYMTLGSSPMSQQEEAPL